MDKKQFTIKIENLVPTLVDIDAKIPCDNDGYSINFDFDAEWASYRVKTGIFVCRGTTHTSVFEGNICKVPRIKDGTRCYIGVVTGEITEVNATPDKKTSRWCEVEAIPTITSIVSEPSAPSHDVYVEFMALLNKYITEGGGGGGLTEEQVKGIVATETNGKFADHEKRIENLESTLLTFIEDTSIAYEKDVPVGVGENAVLSSIGGATKTSKNLLDPSAFGFPVNEDGSVRVSYDFGDEPYYNDFYAFVTLPKGNYYLTYESKTIRGEDVTAYSRFSGEGDDSVAHLTEEREVTIQITLEGGGLCEADTYIMLSTDPDAEFEPFFEGERYGKVTAVESYNSSLIDDVEMFKELGWVKQPNGYWLGSSASKLIFENTEQISGAMTISYTAKTLTANGTSNSVLSMRIRYTDGTEAYGCNITDKSFNYAIRKYTTAADKTVSKISIAYGISGTFDIKDLRIDWGTDVGERVIDTFNIPQEIQALNGYGKDGFVFNLENKTTEYEGEVTDVSQYLTGYDKFKTIKVQGGGKVRFVSEIKLPVPSEITYVKAKE